VTGPAKSLKAKKKGKNASDKVDLEVERSPGAGEEGGQGGWDRGSRQDNFVLLTKENK